MPLSGGCGCERSTSLEEVIEAMTHCGVDRMPGLVGLLYELHKSMPNLFEHLLAGIYINW